VAAEATRVLGWSQVGRRRASFAPYLYLLPSLVFLAAFTYLSVALAGGLSLAGEARARSGKTNRARFGGALRPVTPTGSPARRQAVGKKRGSRRTRPTGSPSGRARGLTADSSWGPSRSRYSKKSPR
jgi:hypothetical protein